MMKLIRVLILLLVLIVVVFYNKMQRLDSTSWTQSLPIVIYPINGDGSEAVSQYINKLTVSNFKSIKTFLDDQHQDYNVLSQDSVNIRLERLLSNSPPSPPKSRNIFSTILWSLQMRWWSYKHAVDLNRTQVNVYVIYHQPVEGVRLAHSLGLQKGLIGVVHAFASDEYMNQNNIVITHEFLHTVGATDKYNLETRQPIFPVGFVIPEEKYNQTRAEIMAGRIPINESESEMPFSLRQCIVGKLTASEIGWLK